MIGLTRPAAVGAGGAWRMGCAAAVDRTRDRVSTSWWADGRAFIGGTASGVPLVSPG